jgi:hypothetical protein
MSALKTTFKDLDGRRKLCYERDGRPSSAFWQYCQKAIDSMGGARMRDEIVDDPHNDEGELAKNRFNGGTRPGKMPRPAMTQAAMPEFAGKYELPGGDARDALTWGGSRAKATDRWADYAILGTDARARWS